MGESSQRESAAEETQLDAEQLEEGYQRWCRIASWVEGDSAAARGASPGRTPLANERSSAHSAPSTAQLAVQRSPRPRRSDTGSCREERNGARPLSVSETPDQARERSGPQHGRARHSDSAAAYGTEWRSRVAADEHVHSAVGHGPGSGNDMQGDLTPSAEASAAEPLTSRASGTLTAEDTRVALAADARRNRVVRLPLLCMKKMACTDRRTEIACLCACWRALYASSSGTCCRYSVSAKALCMPSAFQ